VEEGREGGGEARLSRWRLARLPGADYADAMMAFLRVVVGVSVVVTAVGAARPVRGEPTRVFILAGQSNMLGYGLEGDLPPELATQSDVQFDFWNTTARLPGGDFAVSVTTDWEALSTRPLQPGGEGHFGPEITFGRTVADALAAQGTDVAIVKVTGQGTNILEHWGRGLPPDLEYPEKSQLYRTLMGSLDPTPYETLAYPDEPTRLDRALARLTDRGIAWELGGLVWAQGENEAGWSAANTYAEHLTQIIADLREDLDAPALPVVLLQLTPNASQSNGGPLPDTGVALVRDAQTAVADSDARVVLVNVDDLSPDQPGGLHFDSDGYREIGVRLANAYLELEPPAAGGSGGGTGEGGATAGPGPGAGAGEANASGGSGGGTGEGGGDAGGDGCTTSGARARSGLGWLSLALLGLIRGARALRARRSG
jgi:hypothetical protein